MTQASPFQRGFRDLDRPVFIPFCLTAIPCGFRCNVRPSANSTFEDSPAVLLWHCNRLGIGDNNVRPLFHKLPGNMIAGHSRVSPVLALKANPKSAMRLPEIVLNITRIMVCTNAASGIHSSRPTLSQYRTTSKKSFSLCTPG